MVFEWPADVPQRLLRDGYRRQPEDMVARDQIDAGPPLRRLIDYSPRQTVTGALNLRPDQADTLEAWRRDVLDLGRHQFTWAITDNGRQVIGRFNRQPTDRRTATRIRRDVEIEVDSPAISAAEISALAAVQDRPPARWPDAVPFGPKRGQFEITPEDRVLRSPAGGPHRSGVATRAEGHKTAIRLVLTTDELAAFELWHRTDAGLGAADLLIPWQGGERLASFDGTYTVEPAGNLLGWAVTFNLYLEMQP